MTLRCVPVLALCACAAIAQAQVLLYDNGDVVSQHGTGAGGADVSITVMNTVISLTNSSTSGSGPLKVADNFTVPPGNPWQLTTMNWYEVQSQPAAGPFYTNFRMTAAYVEIYAGNPRLGGTLVAGDLTHNRLTGGAWTGVYRINSNPTAAQLLNTQRPIFRLDLDMSWAPPLPPGEYYVAVSATGDPALATGIGCVPIPQQPGHTAEQFFSGAWVTTPITITFPFKLFGTTGPTCGTSDFDGDGDFGTDFDIQAFFACLGGNCCATCFAGGSDFNGDGDFGTDLDIQSFFSVLGGAGCLY